MLTFDPRPLSYFMVIFFSCLLCRTEVTPHCVDINSPPSPLLPPPRDPWNYFAFILYFLFIVWQLRLPLQRKDMVLCGHKGLGEEERGGVGGSTGRTGDTGWGKQWGKWKEINVEMFKIKIWSKNLKTKKKRGTWTGHESLSVHRVILVWN